MDTDFEEGIYTSQIVGFENYVVSNRGQVFNLNTGREMVLSPNQFGDLSVGLRRGDGSQHRRSVKILVADAFVQGKSPRFNTPILLNGDKTDLRMENIVWRPRWFAWKYAHQFVDPQDQWFRNPVRDLSNGEVYNHIFHASITNAILCEDISLSVSNNSRVWPTGQVFVYI